MFHRTFLAFVLLSLPLVAPAAHASAAPVPLTAEEYKLYKDYLAALEDERVKKIPEEKRLAAIAKNFRVNEPTLTSAIAKGEQHAEDLAARSEEAIRALIEETPLKGRVFRLEVEAAGGHVIAFIGWNNLEGTKLEEEAAYAAYAASKGAPAASTIAVWANDAGSGQKVFEAKVSGSAAAKFNKDRVGMFASRYIRVFEDVRNAYKGTPPEPAISN